MGAPPAEMADQPSPKTRWSARASAVLVWSHCHETMRADAQAYVSQRGGGMRLVLLGDSITETWRGTSMCKPTGRARGVNHVLRETLGALSDVPPLVLGISGDQTQHLLWRLQNGELSPAMRADPNLVYVMLIGTNNLPRRFSPAAVASGILAVSKYILGGTSGRLLINAVLPRADGDNFRPKPTSRLAAGGWAPAGLRSPAGFSPPVAVPGGASGRHPNPNGSRRRLRAAPSKWNASFLPLIEQVNHAVHQAVHTPPGGAPMPGDESGALARAFPGRVAFVDCSAVFLTPRSARLSSAPSIRRELMPDLLHPNAAGHRLWAACIEQGLRNISWLREK